MPARQLEVRRDTCDLQIHSFCDVVLARCHRATASKRTGSVPAVVLLLSMSFRSRRVAVPLSHRHQLLMYDFRMWTCPFHIASTRASDLLLRVGGCFFFLPVVCHDYTVLGSECAAPAASELPQRMPADRLARKDTGHLSHCRRGEASHKFPGWLVGSFDPRRRSDHCLGSPRSHQVCCSEAITSA